MEPSRAAPPFRSPYYAPAQDPRLNLELASSGGSCLVSPAGGGCYPTTDSRLGFLLELLWGWGAEAGSGSPIGDAALSRSVATLLFSLA